MFKVNNTHVQRRVKRVTGFCKSAGPERGTTLAASVVNARVDTNAKPLMIFDPWPTGRRGTRGCGKPGS